MTTETTTASTTEAPTKLKSILDFPNRTVYDSIDSAMAFLGAQVPLYDGLAQLAQALAGFTENGPSPEVYNDEMDVMIQVMSEKGVAAKGEAGKPGHVAEIPRKVTALCVFPIPKVSTAGMSDAMASYVEKILHKEFSLVALRPIRNSVNITQAANEMPTTVDGYISSSREPTGANSAFDSLFKSTLAAFRKNKNLDVLNRYSLTKRELAFAMSNAAYALDSYPKAEAHPKFGSLFVLLAKSMIRDAAKPDIALNSTTLERWLSTRDAQTYAPKADGSTSENDAELNALLGFDDEEEDSDNDNSSEDNSAE